MIRKRTLIDRFELGELLEIRPLPRVAGTSQMSQRDAKSDADDTPEQKSDAAERAKSADTQGLESGS